MAHNGTKFDFQLILRELDIPNLGHVYMIGDDSEGLKTMKFRGLHFIDSYSFLTMSLDKAVNELRLSGHDFPLLAQSKLYRGSLQREMLLKKGLFCYEHFSNYQEMAEQTTFPPLESFRSSLRAELPSRTEYDEALRVWHCFGCKNMLSYLRLYCCLDVVLLAESVMNFRYVNLFLKVDRGDDEINGSEGDFLHFNFRNELYGVTNLDFTYFHTGKWFNGFGSSCQADLCAACCTYLNGFSSSRPP